MIIGGFQETSLLDYPEKICAIIWTVGCNFNCPFCYNKDLINGNVKIFLEDEIISFLKKRKGMLDALSISGGEPLLQKDIENFIKKVKKLGYLIKIDTNGMYPGKLNNLLNKNLIDYIAMDVKAPKDKYEKLAGVSVDIKKIEESIEIIKDESIDYEFKTTFVPDFLTQDDIIKIAKWLKGSKKYYLQQFKVDIPLVSHSFEKLTPYPKNYFKKTLEKIKPFFNQCEIRGI